MIKKFFKALFNFNSNLDYCPRFIEKGAYPKILTHSSDEAKKDYKDVRLSIENLSPCIRVAYAYVPVKTRR